jgi:hypothetical protein
LTSIKRTEGWEGAGKVGESGDREPIDGSVGGTFLGKSGVFGASEQRSDELRGIGREIRAAHEETILLWNTVEPASLSMRQESKI